MSVHQILMRQAPDGPACGQRNAGRLLNLLFEIRHFFQDLLGSEYSLEKGARELATFASTLTEQEWQARLPKDGRKVGVIVHHVATVYPLEIQFAQSVAHGKPADITAEAVNEMNASHAEENDAVTKAETLRLLADNSASAAAAIRSLTDEELDRVAPVPLYGNAIVTCQFVLEDHAVRHSHHHLARIRAALTS